MTRIAYIGNFRPAHSTENHYAASFDALGHTVHRVQEPPPIEEGPGRVETLAALVADAKRGDVDLVLYTRTRGIPRLIAEPAWRAIEAEGVQTAAVHLDRWWGLDRWSLELGSEGMFQTGTVFTADGDHDWDSLGINHRWLPPGVLAAEAYDAQPRPEWQGRWDVAFVGSAPGISGGTYHPEWPHRAELVQWLRSEYRDRFVHVGNGGDLANNQDRPNLRGHELNEFYASVPVVVGDSCLVRRDGLYWSDRVPETWGRGGFLIHPGVQALDDELGGLALPGSLWEPGNWANLRTEVDAWLGAPAEREEQRQRIAALVRERMTYTQRAQQMLAALGLEAS